MIGDFRRDAACATMILIAVAGFAPGCGRTADPHAAWREVATQVSTRPAHQLNQAGPALSVSNLLARGDHGWGLLPDNAGAVIVHSGLVYRVADDGSASPSPPDAAVSFAQVTWFAPDAVLDVMDLDPRLFQNMMRWKQPDVGWIKALRITGHFATLELRAPAAAAVRGAEGEARTLDRANGVVLGFQMPAVAGGVAPPGYTLFYLSHDRSTGGVVGKFTLRAGRIEIDDTPALHIELPALQP